VWDVVKSAPFPYDRLFHRLKQSYDHQVQLKLYEYQGAVQVQVHIHSDQIFYSWPLHMLTDACPPLFRGMVLQFQDTNTTLESDQSSTLSGIALRIGLGCRLLLLLLLPCASPRPPPRPQDRSPWSFWGSRSSSA
jgi:hypothetical protein